MSRMPYARRNEGLGFRIKHDINPKKPGKAWEETSARGIRCLLFRLLCSAGHRDVQAGGGGGGLRNLEDREGEHEGYRSRSNSKSGAEPSPDKEDRPGGRKYMRWGNQAGWVTKREQHREGFVRA